MWCFPMQFDDNIMMLSEVYFGGVDVNKNRNGGARHLL